MMVVPGRDNEYSSALVGSSQSKCYNSLLKTCAEQVEPSTDDGIDHEYSSIQ